MNKVYIVGAKRSAIGVFGGALKDVTAADMAAEVAKGAMAQAGVDPKDIDQAIVGNVLMAGQGMGPGRQAAVKAGLPVETPGYTVNMLCGSGMKAVMTGAVDIRAGEADLVLAGGMESMSGAPFMMPAKVRWGNKLGSMEVEDHLIRDGLTDVFNDYHMGVTAENIAKQYSLTREEQDEFALESQKRAGTAVTSGRFADEIHPIEVKTRKATVTVDTDEYPRLDATLEGLQKLRPAFDREGTVTAGNASGINDGAAMLVLASAEAVEKYGLEPLAEITSFAQAGVAPEVMGLGPVPAIGSALEKAGKDLKDMELIELNEAFAAQSLGVIRGLEVEHGIDKNWMLERTNVNGGAIALGHPVGASGARIIVTLLYEMKKRKVSTGLASLCIGGGMGTAIVLKAL